MKRILIVFLFTVMGLTALLFVVSCSNQTPNTAFIAPLQAIATHNPPSYTWTPTFTSTFTITPTPIPYPVSGFNAPYALAVDSKNNIYVGDTTNNLIKQYVNGVYNTSWPPKTKNGLAYTLPKAIAVDNSGNLYVVGNVGTGNTVSKYDSNGDTPPLQYSASMSSTLYGVAVNNTASVLYVSDSGNSRIVSLSLPAGGLNTAFNGTGILPLSSVVPYGLAVDNTGRLLIAGSDGNVHVYTSAGSAAATIQGFNAPYAVALDVNNNLYVSDTGNHQIEEFGFASGSYTSSPVNIIGSGTLVNPEGIALDSSANVYVVDSGNSELFQFP